MIFLNCSYSKFRQSPPAYLSENRLLRPSAAEIHSTLCISVYIEAGTGDRLRT
ncbi:MAG: hypothetical protein LBL39_02615 [Planctomycetaceae bacterium]|nr:hypothetical protein [Planctomycetaceae bacterium]